MKIIEQYEISAEGYHPFLIRDGWQVAQLNYSKEQEIDAIEKLDVHHLTDEVFVLMKGEAVLIGAAIDGASVSLEVKKMQPNITYNIPVNTWHNVAMKKGCELLIIERSETHMADFEFFPLTEEKKNEMRILVNDCFDQY